MFRDFGEVYIREFGVIDGYRRVTTMNYECLYCVWVKKNPEVGEEPLDTLFVGSRRTLCNKLELAFHKKFGLHICIQDQRRLFF